MVGHSQKRSFQLFMLYQLAKGFLNSNSDKAVLKLEGKTKVKFTDWLANKYKNSSFFYALSKKDISNKKFLRLCAFAYYTKGRNFYPGDLISQEVLEKYIEFQTFIDSYPASFSAVLYGLESEKNIDIIMLQRKGINFPLILELYCSGKIPLGFILAFEKMTNVLKNFDANLGVNSSQRFIWDHHYRAIKKWNQFLFDDFDSK